MRYFPQKPIERNRTILLGQMKKKVKEDPRQTKAWRRLTRRRTLRHCRGACQVAREVSRGGVPVFPPYGIVVIDPTELVSCGISGRERKQNQDNGGKKQPRGSNDLHPVLHRAPSRATPKTSQKETRRNPKKLLKEIGEVCRRTCARVQRAALQDLLRTDRSLKKGGW